MIDVRLISCFVAATLCLAIASATSEKQIKLEDIEKDTLKAAQQAKYEKQIQQQQQQQQLQLQQQQQQQQQHQQLQQTSVQYEPQVYTHQNIAYQTPTSYSRYLIPQQYITQAVLPGYEHLAGNSLGAGYAAPSANAFQTYFSPQIATIPSISGYHGSQSLSAATQTQPIIMAFTTPTIAALQHQPYYQSALQYYPSQTGQTAQFYYTPQTTEQASASHVSSGLVYPSSSQQFITSYQPITATKTASGYTQQHVSTAPQTFPLQSYTTQQDYSQVYSPQSYSSNSVYSNTETPTFVTVKAPQHLVASQGQQQQFFQAHPTTMSPLQVKYLNSPQYLAQNYNTIQSSQLYPKGFLSSGVKSTASPPVKASPSSPYISNSFGSASSSVTSYQPYRSVPSKSF